jgi:hypothetical protein
VHNPRGPHANPNLFFSRFRCTHLCHAAAGGEQANRLGGKWKGNRRKVREEEITSSRLVFDPPDISLEKTVHSLADANTMVASIYTLTPAGRSTRAGSSRRRREGFLARTTRGGGGGGGGNSAATKAPGRRASPRQRLPLAACGGSGSAAAAASRSATPPAQSEKEKELVGDSYWVKLRCAN